MSRTLHLHRFLAMAIQQNSVELSMPHSIPTSTTATWGTISFLSIQLRHLILLCAPMSARTKITMTFLTLPPIAAIARASSSMSMFSPRTAFLWAWLAPSTMRPGHANTATMLDNTTAPIIIPLPTPTATRSKTPPLHRSLHQGAHLTRSLRCLYFFGGHPHYALLKFFLTFIKPSSPHIPTVS